MIISPLDRKMLRDLWQMRSLAAAIARGHGLRRGAVHPVAEHVPLAGADAADLLRAVQLRRRVRVAQTGARLADRPHRADSRRGPAAAAHRRAGQSVDSQLRRAGVRPADLRARRRAAACSTSCFCGAARWLTPRQRRRGARQRGVRRRQQAAASATTFPP